MKLIFVLLACCLAVDLAKCDIDKEQDRLREKAMEECRMEKKLTEEEAKNLSNLGCMYACMHKKVGYLNSDGTLNVERVTRENPNTHFQEVVRSVYQECVEKAKGDPCQVSLCLENTKVG